MKIDPNKPLIGFQKTLKAKCVFKQGKDERHCSIYKLDSAQDKDYFKKLMNKGYWEGAKFLRTMDRHAQHDCTNSRINDIFVIEDDYSNCLGYMRLDNYKESEIDLTHLETVPIYSHRNPRRKFKYIGESLITFLIGLAKRQNKKRIYIPYIMADARDFYFKKCKFKSIGTIENSKAELKNTNFLKLEKQNTFHTGTKIELIE